MLFNLDVDIQKRFINPQKTSTKVALGLKVNEII
jgi:hypothetical protein